MTMTMPDPSLPLTGLQLSHEKWQSRTRFEAACGTSNTYRRDWRRWEKRLLEHGGQLVKHLEGHERDLTELLEHASIRHVGSDTTSVFYGGVPHQCHANVAALWVAGRTPDRRHQIAEIHTGYALSNDGLWRQHSWAVTDAGYVIETTEPCVTYAGVVRSGAAAAVFAILNHL